MELNDSEFLVVKELIKKHRDELTVLESDKSRISRFLSYTKIIAGVSASISSIIFAIKFISGIK